jgi:hypothetical protein
MGLGLIVKLKIILILTYCFFIVLRLNQNFVILHNFVNLMNTKNTFIWQKKFKTNLLEYLNKVEKHSIQNSRLFLPNVAVLKLGVTTLFRVAKY